MSHSETPNMPPAASTDTAGRPPHFLRTIIAEDLAAGRLQGDLITRFPPEPNGYLHIGHAKSICLNFGLAQEFGGRCHLRFDDTNPEKESQEYIDAIQEDVRWLGYQWDGPVRYASDYFQQLYEWALDLIEKGLAYVCHLSAEEASEYRGWATRPGRESPYRNRSVAENRSLFERMRNGEFADGECVLRAKIDMASPNMNLRDPILYRIRKAHHHQTGDTWCIYPSYDYAHGQSDAIEHITHSICTLEFQDHRPLYDWLIEHLPVPARPRQYEFARLNLSYTVTSKRKLKRLVDEGVVTGWNDPRMPTLAGMRRRGYTPAAIRRFCEMIGVTRADGVVDVAMLEHALRDDLNESAPRAMCVMNPLKVVVTNFTEEVEWMTAPAHPGRPELGERRLPFTRELYIDRADFNEDATLPRKRFRRLVPGDWVRLRSAYVIRADEVIKDDSGEIVELRVSLVPGTVGADAPAEIKPRGVIHWVSASHGVPAELRLYERLFTDEAPDAADKDFMDCLNPASLRVIQAILEPDAARAPAEQHFQFEREGYFVADRFDHRPDLPVFNQIIALRDSGARG